MPSATPPIRTALISRVSRQVHRAQRKTSKLLRRIMTVRFGSKAGITAVQQQSPVHLNERTEVDPVARSTSLRREILCDPNTRGGGNFF
jgi:hypothetical protein